MEYYKIDRSNVKAKGPRLARKWRQAMLFLLPRGAARFAGKK
jgi:hypothetical protein